MKMETHWRVSKRLEYSPRREALRWERVRDAVGFLVLFGGAVALGAVGHAHYPIQHWLFWRYGAYWLVSGAWVLACVSGGSWALRALDVELPALDHLLFSFATGVLLFVWGIFLAGMMGMFRPLVAVLWPCALLALGGRRAWATARGLRRLLRARPFTWPERLATGFGLLGLAMVYFTILTPQNVGFDSQWYHLPIAEHYVAAGAIVPFEEGWFLGTYPHLASLVYGWGFLLPGATVFDKVLIAAHLEFMFFLATLASIPLLIRRLIDGPRPRASWAALFLFPGIFLYDGSLFVAADHILAFWAIPVYLALTRAARRLTARRCVLLAIVLAGALLTKYQAIYLLVPAAATIAYAAARTLHRQGDVARVSLSLATLALACCLLTAPHWFMNWWWYGDPLYPYLRHHLVTHPWSPSAARDLEAALQSGQWRPTGTAYAKLRETAGVLLTFSFEPHDWPTYHGAVPVFGSLFTIASLLVPLLKRAARLLHLVACTLAGVAVWYLTFHQDRYLQTLVPWMVCATVAILQTTWTQLPLLRPFLVLLAALQVVWAGDVYFIPANDDSHELNRPSPIKSAVDLLSSGYRKEYTERLHPYEPWETIGASLPRGAKILLHERYLHLGLGAMSVTDLPTFQGAISYEDAATPQPIFARLSALGVTHVLWETGVSHGQDRMAGDLAFFRFATQWTTHRQTFGKFTVARIEPVSAPSSESPRVAWYECPGERGMLRSLKDVEEDADYPSIPMLSEAEGPPDDVEFVVMSKTCRIAWSSVAFEHMADRGNYELWTRRVTGF